MLLFLSARGSSSRLEDSIDPEVYSDDYDDLYDEPIRYFSILTFVKSFCSVIIATVAVD